MDNDRLKRLELVSRLKENYKKLNPLAVKRLEQAGLRMGISVLDFFTHL